MTRMPYISESLTNFAAGCEDATPSNHPRFTSSLRLSPLTLFDVR